MSLFLIRGCCYSGNNRIGEFRTPVLWSNRRRDLISRIGVASALLPRHSSLASPGDLSYERLATTTKTVRYIRQFCNAEFLSCVVQSRYGFLYRGLSPRESEAAAHKKELAAIIVTDEPHDLLNPDTYQSNDAALYFSSLEKDMAAKGLSIKPSTSHLGTTCLKEAAQWGTAASIWPLGETGVEFAWLKEGGVFWPNKEGGLQRKRSIVTSSTNNGDGRGMEGLPTALQGEAWEIMFRAENGFLAVPAALDKELRASLMEMK